MIKINLTERQTAVIESALFKDGLEFNEDIKEFKRWEKFEDNINKELLKIRKKYLEV